ncbi:MAG: hypothetical protein HOK82_19130 [Rhodospirillaceae bacterium]|nr:hypothetical protein [Rhodospirillaceae bacterium]
MSEIVIDGHVAERRATALAVRAAPVTDCSGAGDQHEAGRGEVPLSF